MCGIWCIMYYDIHKVSAYEAIVTVVKTNRCKNFTTSTTASYIKVEIHLIYI